MQLPWISLQREVHCQPLAVMHSVHACSALVCIHAASPNCTCLTAQQMMLQTLLPNTPQMLTSICCYSCNILWTCRWISVQTEFASSIERCLQAIAAPQYGISTGVQLSNEFLECLVDCHPLAIVDSISILLFTAALCCCVSVMFL